LELDASERKQITDEQAHRQAVLEHSVPRSKIFQVQIDHDKSNLYERLRERREVAYKASALPDDARGQDRLHDLLVRLRLGGGVE
jgi:hypothetical protein